MRDIIRCFAYDLLSGINKRLNQDEDDMLRTRIVFENAKVLEQDAALQIADEADDEGLMIVYLQQELYRQSDGTYEVHLLLAVEGQPCYLTIRCSDIRFERV